MANNTEKIQNREITEELKESYLDYAMSVIVSRALPDVRDGLKPVHRRILWSMWESGLTHSAKFLKSANVIGAVLARYHPHGDAAVYEAMVRMAQDFSLRAPLVDGQGNFGCFTKDVKVRLTDGRSLSFEELIKEHQDGKRNYTYTVNGLGLIAIAEIKNPRRTKLNTPIIKVVLDNDNVIRCTPDHLFLLKNGVYKEARHLKPKDSLMPLYMKFSEKTDRLNREGYFLIYQPKKDGWIPTHHLADDYNLTHKRYRKTDGRVRHHLDFNKLNNNPENIKRLHWDEHWKIHYQHAADMHKDEDYRKSIAAGRKAYWSKPENKAKKAAELSYRNKENWKRPEYREKMRRFLSEVNKKYIAEHPEKRKEFSERATKTLKRLWQDTEYSALFREKIIKGNKNHTTNRTGRLKFLNIALTALNEFGVLNPETYKKARMRIYSYGAAPLWETGLNKYFSNQTELVLQELNKNHKIVRIEDAGREDVYDLTIEGTNNFALDAGIFVHNSIDGDSAAAYRYTEARLSRIAEELLLDIDKETVDWQPNYDGTKQEPKVLPAKLPNLLLNGAMGIAVGMTTNIPPHNLNELIDATLLLIDNPKTFLEDLSDVVQGPDFPTGGIIYNKREIAKAYASGRGPITARGVAEIIERKNGFNIVITEIPYQVNKAELIIKMAELVQEKRVDGIRDIRDESDREGLRIVIELKNDAVPQKVLNQLYQHTDLQKDFHMNMLALANGIQPQIMSLKDVLSAYIEHRKIVIRRRAEFDLKKAEERAHILEGLAMALSVIDKIIAAIKKSEDRNDARKNLIKNFKLTEIQANAILEMRLQTLAALERQKIEDELKEKRKLIGELQILLKSPQKILKVLKDELAELKNKFGEPRRTKVVAGGLKEFKEEDLIPEEEAVITFSQSGYIKRLPPGTFKVQRRGGKGLIGSEVGDEDFITHFMPARTHDNILFFTDRGRVFQTKVYEIPQATRTAKGKAIQNFLEIPPQENVSAIVSYHKAQSMKHEAGAGKYLVMLTKNGVIKKTSLEEFENVRRSGIIALKLQKGDMLKWVKLSSGNGHIIITTALGQAIRFKETDARPMGRNAGGTRAIRLKKDDYASSLDIINKDVHKSHLLVVMANGFGKRTTIVQFRIQRRGGSGIKAAKITAKTGHIISAHVIDEQQTLFAISAKGQIIKTDLASVRIAGRATQGVKIMSVRAGDKVVGAACL